MKQEARKLIHEIVDVIADLKNDHHMDVMFDYAGHVECFSIRLFSKGWHEDEKCTKCSMVHQVEPDYKAHAYCGEELWEGGDPLRRILQDLLDIQDEYRNRDYDAAMERERRSIM
jgi:hypothetical protein